MSSRCVVLGLLAFIVGVSSARGQSTFTYQQEISMARARAARVAIARARIDDVRGRLTGAHLRPRDNPVFDAAAGPRWLENVTVTDFDIGVSQVFELGGRRGARIAAAEAGVMRETAISDASTRQVVHDVAVSFVRALQAQTRLDVL